MKNLLIASLCLLASHTSFAQDTQPPPDVEALRNLLLKRIVYQEYPEYPEIWVVFFDLNHDGIPEALATHKSHDYSGTGGGGYMWFSYQFKNGKWDEIPEERTANGRLADPYNNVDAPLWNGFFSLTREGQKPTLVAQYHFDGKGDEGKTFRTIAKEVTIDADGYLKVIRNPELSHEIFMTWDDLENDRWPEREEKKLDYKLVPVPVIKIYPQQDEIKETPPVATAEAGVQEGEKTSSSQGKLAKQDGAVVEQEKSENKSNPNRLWLYAGILLLVCVGFYVLRRKLKTGN